MGYDVWLPIFFGSKLGDLWALEQTLIAFAAFCLAASGVYVLNDLKDIQEDRRHPTKRNRPLASGAIPRRGAVIFMTGLLLLATLAGSLLPKPDFLLTEIMRQPWPSRSKNGFVEPSPRV